MDSPRLVILEKTDSTNTYVKNHFADLADGTLVAALEQTNGRGRAGHGWISPPRRNITATAKFEKLTAGYHGGIILGLAALELVNGELGNDSCYFKWPNDLYCGKRKIAGILSEGIIFGGKLVGTATGIGLNVNMSASELATIDQPATSLKNEKNCDFNVQILLKKLAYLLLECYIKYSEDYQCLRKKWLEYNRLIGRVLTFRPPSGEEFQAQFADIDTDGAALTILSDGSVRRFDCGDVKIGI